MLWQFEFHQIQTPQLVDNTFEACGLDICSTILHVGEFSIPIGSYNLEGYAKLTRH